MQWNQWKSLVVPNSKTTHRGVKMARTLGQHQQETPVRRAEHCQGWEPTNGDAFSIISYCDTCTQCQKLEWQSGRWKVWVIPAAAADGWNHAALRREQVDDNMEWSYGKWRLDGIQCERMSLITVPSTVVTDLNGGERWCAGPSLVNPDTREIA